ncbi:MAG: YhcH/YjgK/YiaL family protein [Gemmiger sp.]|nr:YhcH/YjgK/YiaL family protein [Gemmiger sp.]
MIYTTLEGMKAYRGLSKNLDLVLDFIATHSLAALPLGKTVICGEDAFVNVMEASTRPEVGAAFEVHHRYADLQVDITGQERFAVLLGAGTTTQEFDPAADFGLLTGPVEGSGLLGGTRCVLFPAGEPHMPTLAVAEPGVAVKKAVFKIIL